MDREQFDALTRLFAATPSRRAALGALLGAGLTGTFGLTEAKKKRKRGKKGSGGAYLSAEAADCLSPGQGSNMSGCPYAGEDFSGDDLSDSRMVGTNFRNATLVDTDLSSSNMAGAIFRGADLCSADLRSSTLRNVDFRGFPATGPNAGNPTNLTRADLSSSACGGVLFNNRTIFCQTTTCNGVIRNDDCPGVDPENVCCVDSDCGPGRTCESGVCLNACPDGSIRLANGSCGFPCNGPEDCDSGVPDCACWGTTEGDLCAVSSSPSGPCPPACLPGNVCVGLNCLQVCGPAPTTFERLRAIIVLLLGVDEDDVTLEAEFVRDLGADSLDLVEIILAAEEEFDLVITDEDAENIRTVGDAVQAIEEHGG